VNIIGNDNEFFNEFKMLFDTNLETVNKINPKNIFPFNVWMGNELSNYKLFLDIEEALLCGMNETILLKELFLKINKFKKFIKTFKYEQEKDELEWIKQKIKEHFSWTDKEINIYWTLFTFVDKNKIANMLGLDNKERKKYGAELISFIKPKKISSQKILKGQATLM